MDTNNWYVITGAPSAGKTTIIELLEKMGHKVSHEVPRAYIDKEIKRGKTIEQIRQNELLFQELVLKMKIDIEKDLPRERIVFFDRGIPDSKAYYKLHGKENDDFLELAIQNSFYKKIFLLDFFEMKKDYARTETRKEQIRIHNLLEEVYTPLNIPIIKVPIMSSKEDRLQFILENL